MEKSLEIGSHVIFTDSKSVEHDAIVTRVWPCMGNMPGCNLVFVSGDETKTDPYGRQLERATSIVHESAQPAGASCWHYPTQ